MSVDEPMVWVRVKVRQSVYRRLFAESQQRRLDGAGKLIELMVNREPMPRRSIGQPPKERRPIPAERVPEIIERVLDRNESVRGLARELGVTRGAIYHYTRPAKEQRELDASTAAADAAAAAAHAAHAAHAPALDELGIVGRPALPVPAVPSL